MTERTKILYVVTKSAWGGAQRYVFDLATRLDARQFDVLVATGGTGPLVERLREGGIRTVSLPSLARDVGLWVDARALWSLLGLYRRERPAIIHLSSSKAGGIGAAAAFLYKLTTRAWGTRVVFTVHGWPFNEDRPRWQRILIFLASWFSTLFHDRVIIITTADYRAAHRFIPEEKLALIFHGIDPIDFLPRHAARAFFGEKIGTPLAPDTVLIGANAELTKNKGLNYLIQSIAQLKSKIQNAKYKILIVGDGEDRLKLEAEITRHGLTERVFLLGFIPEVKRYLKGLDLFVLPSVKEGLPYAMLEAMAAGLPIVASRVGGTPDLIRDGESGLLVRPKDPLALAGAIGRVLADRGHWAGLGRKARERTLASFPMDAMLARTIALYGAA
ncbi:MAG: glycosyltransferase [bacterium]|nr:glycosyltransferase [bacterium]